MLYDIQVNAIDGQPSSLGAYRGKVLLVVNVASQCGLTPQYAQLEQVYRLYRERGFEVLGFPANEFGAQEPGSNREIQQFCTTTFAVDFPMFEKLVVKGASQHPLYQRLTHDVPRASGDVAGFREKLRGFGIDPGGEDEITWNVEKFLVDRAGNPVARFSPSMTPDDPAIASAIERELAK